MFAMEKWTLVLLVMLTYRAQADSFPFKKNLRLLIDCGVKGETSEDYNNQTWLPDSMFIDSGKVNQINTGSTVNIVNVPQFMNTLRSFPKGDKQCYTLPLTNACIYIIRAGFYYGNYDGKSQPPTFDLFLGGQFWTSVNSSTSDRPIFHELIYRPKNDDLDVCLMGTKDGGIPFISSLEASFLGEYAFHPNYGKVKNGTAYHLVGRLNFGSYDKVIEPWSGWNHICEEQFNRYWMPQQIPGYNNITFDSISCTGESYENRSPNSVINTAITSLNTSQSIYFPIIFPNTTPQSVYIVLYFYHNLNVNGSPSLNVSRNMDIYIDGVMKRNVNLNESISGEVVTLYPVLVQNVTNVTISPVNGTKLPPLLNALEVFMATELSEEISNDGSMFFHSSIMACFFHGLYFLFLFRFS